MKSLRTKLFLPLMSTVLLSLSTAAFAQSDEHKHGVQSEAHQPAAQSDAQPSDAQKSFAALKTLAGTWEGHGTTTPPVPDMPDIMRISLEVTSSGHALKHEMMGKGKNASPAKDPDHPLTMLYLDGDRLLLNHYCDAGNRPRMEAKSSPDGKTVEFSFLDVAGSTKHGHMDHAVFTIIDANHHTEDWTYLMPGDKPMYAHIDLQRVQQQTASAR
jgi:hypothetical protein